MRHQGLLAATGAIGIALCSIGAAMAGADLVAYPEGYQNSFTHYTTRNRDDERKQVVKIFANEVALASARDGAPLDAGSVIVMEVYKAELDPAGDTGQGRRRPVRASRTRRDHGDGDA